MLELQIARPEDTFKNVIALYAALIENRSNMRVRQVALNTNGEVPAEPLDFLLDVEKKAQRVLTPRQYALFIAYSYGGHPELIPADAQLALGTIWHETNLDIEGPYRTLYFRVKNRMEREKIYAASGTDNSNES